LYKIPLEKIENIYSQVEGPNAVKSEVKSYLELSLKYDGLEEEKYIVNQLTGKLLENFKDKKIPAEVERNGINLKLPDLYYIHNKVALLLDGVQQHENNKLEKQSGGIYFSPLSLSNDGIISSNEIRYPRMINKNKRGGFPMNNFNDNNGYNGNSENYKTSSNNEDNENDSYGNKKKSLNIKKNKPKSQSQQYQKEKSLSSLEKELEEFEKKPDNNNNKKNNNNKNNNKKNNNKIYIILVFKIKSFSIKKNRRFLQDHSHRQNLLKNIYNLTIKSANITNHILPHVKSYQNSYF